MWRTKDSTVGRSDVSAARGASFSRSLLGLTLGLMMLGGCAAPDPYFTPPQPAGDPLPNYPQVVALEGLSMRLLVDHPMVEASSIERPMRVSVPVRLRGMGDAANIQYAFQFFDGTGRPLDDGDSWRFVRLESRAQEYIEAGAMSSEAVDWQLTLRLAR